MRKWGERGGKMVNCFASHRQDIFFSLQGHRTRDTGIFYFLEKFKWSKFYFILEMDFLQCILQGITAVCKHRRAGES